MRKEDPAVDDDLEDSIEEPELLEPEKTIVALGVVIFDKSKLKCTLHPNQEEQYLSEWVFANLDKNGDSYLDQTELEELRATSEPLSDEIQTGPYSMSFADFVKIVW